MPGVLCVTGYVCERREGGGGGRVMLYLQDDDPSVSPLAWLGVGGAAGPIGWTASDGTVARDPSAAVAVAPPEPLDLSKVLKVQVPEDSAGVKLETWLSPDGKKMPSPCLELVRRSREVSNRIAEIEREQKMLMDDLKQASLLMRRSEHEVKILSGRASGGGGKREREQLLFNAKTLLSQRAMSFQTKRQHYVALAHQQKEEKRALDKIQDEIEKVRKGSGILAVFATPTSTSSARTAPGSSMGRTARGSSMAAPNVDSTRIFSHVPREVTDGGDHARPTSQATYPARQRGPDSWISPLRAPSEDRHWNDREPAARSPFMSGVAVVDDILQSGYSAVFCNPEGPGNLEMRAGGTRGRPGWCASDSFRGIDRKESSKEAVSSSNEVKAGLTLITARSPSPALKRFGRPTRTPGLSCMFYLSQLIGRARVMHVCICFLVAECAVHTALVLDEH